MLISNPQVRTLGNTFFFIKVGALPTSFESCLERKSEFGEGGKTLILHWRIILKRGKNISG